MRGGGKVVETDSGSVDTPTRFGRPTYRYSHALARINHTVYGMHTINIMILQLDVIFNSYVLRFYIPTTNSKTKDHIISF